jgi:hypothetical protein
VDGDPPLHIGLWSDLVGNQLIAVLSLEMTHLFVFLNLTYSAVHTTPPIFFFKKKIEKKNDKKNILLKK